MTTRSVMTSFDNTAQQHGTTTTDPPVVSLPDTIVLRRYVFAISVAHSVPVFIHSGSAPTSCEQPSPM